MVFNGWKWQDNRVAVRAEEWGAAAVQLGKKSGWVCWAKRVHLGCYLYRDVFLYSLIEVDPPTMLGTGTCCMIVRGMQQCAGMFGHLHAEKPALVWCM